MECVNGLQGNSPLPAGGIASCSAGSAGIGFRIYTYICYISVANCEYVGSERGKRPETKSFPPAFGHAFLRNRDRLESKWLRSLEMKASDSEPL
jgi:hypothetical protein